MNRIEGPTCYLLVKRSSSGDDHQVLLLQDFNKVVTNWSRSARVSPIFPLHSTRIGDEGPVSNGYVYLVARLPPQRLPENVEGRIFLSLGIFNVVVLCRAEQRSKFERFLNTEGLLYERWRLKAGNVTEVVSNPSDRKAFRLKRAKAPKLQHHPALSAAIKEYELLIATSIERGAFYLPEVAGSVIAFDRSLRTEVSELPVRLQQRLLVIANATLSRQTSQTYAGTSPVAETECHYWPHSLLGIGIASVALARIRSYLDWALARANILGRLERLSAEDPHPEDLAGLPAADPFWQTDHLCPTKEWGRSGSSPLEDGEAEIVPSLTSYSGRDGFRSTQVSLTAPLEVISASNTRTWSLLTLTHEVTHDLVGQFGAFMLPRPRDRDKVSRLRDLIKDESRPKNLLDQLRALVGFCIWRIGRSPSREPLTVPTLQTAIEDNWSSFNEGLTHCLDYLYFYRREPQEYIRSLWVSWSTVPNVASRVRHYIVRCLTALMCNNLERDNINRATYTELLDTLHFARERHPDVEFIELGLRIISEEEDELLENLTRRQLLAKIARYILYSPRIEKLLWDEPLAQGGAGDRGLKYLTFGPETVRNPLRFVGDFCTQKRPDQRRSAWLLYQLAFSEDREAGRG